VNTNTKIAKESAISFTGMGLGQVSEVLITPDLGMQVKISKLVITSSIKYVMQNTRTVQIFGFQCG